MFSCLPKISSMAPSMAVTMVATRYNVERSSDMIHRRFVMRGQPAPCLKCAPSPVRTLIPPLLENRLHAYASFQEKLRQLLGKSSAKRAPEGALLVFAANS